MSAVSDTDRSPVDPRIVRTRKDVLNAALLVLVEEGADAVTHANLARFAGYSKATIYKHWPTRADLLGDALRQVGDVEHHTPTGDLRTDLIAEVSVYRREMEHNRLDRALVVLVSLIGTMPELATVRDKLVADGERVVRELLSPHLRGARLDAAALMLLGGTLQSALMHGAYPSDAVIASSVDLVLRNFDLDDDGSKPVAAKIRANRRNR